MNTPPDSNVVVALNGGARAAVASLLVDGPKACQLVDKCFASRSVPSAHAMTVDRIHFGTWQTSSHQEDLVLSRVESQRFEIHCHGGAMAHRALLDSLIALGAKEVAFEDWIDTEVDASMAAARLLLPRAQTERTAGILLDQLRGAVQVEVAKVQQLIHQGATDTAVQRIRAVTSRAEVAEHIVSGWSVVIAGPPNSGKSSLINRLVGYERAVVSGTMGTTRDLVEASTAVDGWPITLTDTAGLRPTVNEIERAGIHLAKQALASADLVLLLSEADRRIDAEIAAIAHRVSGRPVLCVGSRSTWFIKFYSVSSTS